MVSGQKLEDYFRQHIFAPLKMDDTFYNVPELKGPRLVAQQQRAGERMDGAIELQKPQLGLNIPAPIGGGGLASTADDYGRFMRMLLNGGVLDGVRVLKAETVALMGQNNIGDLTVGKMTTSIAWATNDVDLYPDIVKKWGLSFLNNTAKTPEGRSAGSLAWAGLANTYFWIDPSKNIAGVILMQLLPFADPQALQTFAEFESRLYKVA